MCLCVCYTERKSTFIFSLRFHFILYSKKKYIYIFSSARWNDDNSQQQYKFKRHSQVDSFIINYILLSEFFFYSFLIIKLSNYLTQVEFLDRNFNLFWYRFQWGQ